MNACFEDLQYLFATANGVSDIILFKFHESR